MFTVIVLSVIVGGIILNRARARQEREAETQRLQLRLLHY